MKSIYLPIMVFCLLALLFLSPILSHIHYWGIHDWDSIAADYLVGRDSILKYGQWPLWNPYAGGGLPIIGDVATFCLSPLFPLILLFGPVVGIKLIALACLIIGLIGTFKLAREWGIKTTGAYLAAFIFMFSSHLSLRIAQGNMEYYGQCWLPWILLFASRLIEKPQKWVRNSILTAFFLSLAFLQGGSLHSLFNLLILSLFLLICSLQSRRVRGLLGLGLIFLLFFSLVSIRLLPVLETKQSAWRVESPGSMQAESLLVLPATFLDRDQSLRSPAREERLRSPSSENWEEYGCYIGWFPILLAFLGLATWKRKRVLLGILLVFFSLLYLGHLSPINLWALLHQIPLFRWLRLPSRSSYIISFIIALSAGYGLTKLEYYFQFWRLKTVLRIGLPVLILIFVFVNLTIISRPLLKISYVTPLQPVEAGEFIQRAQPIWIPLHRMELGSHLYMKYLQNQGEIAATHTDIYFARSAISQESCFYRGEWYLTHPANKNYCRLKKFTPNAVWLEVFTQKPNIVVLNQNYFSGWRVKGFPGAEATFYKGKIGIPVPPGQHQLKAYFLPRTFLWGFSLTLLAIGLSLWFLLRPFRPVWFVIIAFILFIISGSYLLFGLQSPPQFQTIKEALDKESAGDLEGAVVDLKTALAYYPESYPVYHQLGLVLTKLGRFPEAVKYYRKALQLWPHWQERPYYFGLAFYHCGEFNEAIKSFREEIRRFPDHIEAINSLAWLLATVPQANLRDGPEALQLAERACEVTNYSNAIFLDTLAAAYAETGQFEEAIQTARKAIERALAKKQKLLAEEIKKHLKMYQARQLYREYIWNF